MDINYYMKIQNAYGTKSQREKQLVKVNRNMKKHFYDTFDTEKVLLNGNPFDLMIIKDTDGNTYKKKIKSPHNQKFNLGDYVKWNGQYWLITLMDYDDKTWNRGYMYLCTVLLRWQNSNGDIIERWEYSEDFTKYSTGTYGNNSVTLGENQYGLTLPVDSETKFLKRDIRFPIDFEEVEPPDIYRLSNKKILLTDATSVNRGGIMTCTLSYDVFNPDTDKKVELDDGRIVWICDYKDTSLSPTKPLITSQPLKATMYGRNNITIGYSRKYSVKFKNAIGDEVDVLNHFWNIVCDFADKIEMVQENGSCKITVTDRNLIGKTFKVQVIRNTEVMTEKSVVIEDTY